MSKALELLYEHRDADYAIFQSKLTPGVPVESYRITDEQKKYLRSLKY